MNEFNHRINWDDLGEILVCKDILKRNVIESCIIKKRRDNFVKQKSRPSKIDKYCWIISLSKLPSNRW